MRLETIIRLLALLRDVEALESDSKIGTIGRLRAEAFCTRAEIQAQLEVAGIKLEITTSD